MVQPVGGDGGVHKQHAGADGQQAERKDVQAGTVQQAPKSTSVRRQAEPEEGQDVTLQRQPSSAPARRQAEVERGRFTMGTHPDQEEMHITGNSLVCQYCGSPPGQGERLLACAKCRASHYCSVARQRRHWASGHREECARKAAQRREFNDPTAYQDIQKWVEKNGDGFYLLVAIALQADREEGSLLQTHVAHVRARYRAERRAVEIQDVHAEVIDEAQKTLQADPTRFGQQDLDLRHMLAGRASSGSPASQPSQIFSVLLITMDTPRGRMLRLVPLRCHGHFMSWLQGPGRGTIAGVDAREVIERFNDGVGRLGTIARSADQVAALARASEEASLARANPAATSRLCELRGVLEPGLTQLVVGLLMLANKTCSLHRTHRVRILMTYDPHSKRSTVCKCEPVAIKDLVASHRKYVPAFHVESRLGEIRGETFEELLTGTSQALKAEAARRKSYYLPVVIACTGQGQLEQFLLPEYHSRASIMNVRQWKLDQTQHTALVQEALRKIQAPESGADAQNGEADSAVL